MSPIVALFRSLLRTMLKRCCAFCVSVGNYSTYAGAPVCSKHLPLIIEPPFHYSLNRSKLCLNAGLTDSCQFAALCPPGRAINANGATVCTACLPGYYAPRSGIVALPTFRSDPLAMLLVLLILWRGDVSRHVSVRRLRARDVLQRHRAGTLHQFFSVVLRRPSLATG